MKSSFRVGMFLYFCFCRIDFHVEKKEKKKGKKKKKKKALYMFYLSLVNSRTDLSRLVACFECMD